MTNFWKLLLKTITKTRSHKSIFPSSPRTKMFWIWIRFLNEKAKPLVNESWRSPIIDHKPNSQAIDCVNGTCHDAWQLSVYRCQPTRTKPNFVLALDQFLVITSERELLDYVLWVIEKNKVSTVNRIKLKSNRCNFGVCVELKIFYFVSKIKIAFQSNGRTKELSVARIMSHV